MGVKAPKYKKFDSREAAEEWIQSIRLSAGPAPEERFDFKDEDVDEDDEEEEAGASPAAKRTKLSSDEIALAITGETVEDLLEIYTDGSTLSNGQTGAVAGVGVFFGDGDPRYVTASESNYLTFHHANPPDVAQEYFRAAVRNAPD